MNARLRVSILVITYNQEHLIEEAVASCLAQTYENLEIVLADDGSKDRTPEILTRLAADNPDRVRLALSEVNGGITANCNAGLAVCTGDLIALMGGDDVLLPHKVERQVEEFLADPELQLSYHPCLLLRDTTASGVVGDRPKDVVTDMIGLIANPGAQMSGPATMVRRTAIPEHGFRTELPMASDWMFFIDVAASGAVRRIDEALALYRVHSGNVGHSFFGYSDDFLKTLEIVTADYGRRAGVESAVRRGGRRFLLGAIYRSVVLDRPADRRRFVAKLRDFANPVEVAAVRAATGIPGGPALFARMKALLKRFV